MIRWNTFSRGILFAALAAGGVLPWLLVARPILGFDGAISAYLVGLVAAHLAGFPRERGRRLGVLVAAALVAGGVAVVARSMTELTLGLGVILAVGRSAFLHDLPAPRAALVETFLVGGGLGFARFLAGHSALALVLAIWGFFLVQSLYALLGGARVRAGEGGHPDRFEEAFARANALLDGGVV